MYYNTSSQNQSHSYYYTTTTYPSVIQPQNDLSNKSASFLLPSTFLNSIAIFLYALATIISLAVIFCCFWCKYRCVEQVHGEDHETGEETNDDNDEDTDDDQIELITETDDEPPNYDWAMIYSSKACRDVLEASSPSPPPYFEAVDSVSPQPNQHYQRI